MSAATAIEQLTAPFSDGRQSIYGLIEAALVERGDKLVDLDVDLPHREDEESEGGNRIRFVAGALDALFGARDSSLKQTKARSVVAAITNVLRQPTTGTARSLYQLLQQSSIQPVVDEVLSRLAPELAKNRVAMATLARRLVRESPDVEPVKLGIALLGIAGVAEDEALILSIGASDEFTLYCVVALIHIFEQPERPVWRLAQRVHGWGRVSAVERLVGTQDQEIKRWLVRGGFRNTIMNEYLACIAARTGELAAALEPEHVDDELLQAAGDILSALVMGGPAEEMEDYADSAAACVSFLRHALQRESPRLEVITSVQDVSTLADGERAAGLKALPGWSAQTFLDIRTQSSSFMQKPGVRAAVERGMASDEKWGDYYMATRLAPRFGIDPWPRHLDRQRSRVGDNWFELMRTKEVDRVEQVVSLAREQLDLRLIGSGPTDSLALGEGYADDQAMDFIVQDLGQFPGVGWDLVKLSLHGRGVRLRHMAINALRDWGRSRWPEDAEAALREAAKREPEADVRERMTDLLAGRLVD